MDSTSKPKHLIYKDLIDDETLDLVNHPSHYQEEGKIESIDYIRERLTPEQYKGGLIFNVHKYVHRWQSKNGKQDLEKANWYLEKLIGYLEE